MSVYKNKRPSLHESRKNGNNCCVLIPPPLGFLTLNKLRGGTKCPKHFRTLTILSMMKYGLSILHVNFFFGVKNHSKIKFWGYWKRNFEKFVFEIFFLWKSKQKILKLFFFQNSFHTQLYFLMKNINSEWF